MQVWPTQIEGVGWVTTWSLIDKGDLISIMSLIYLLFRLCWAFSAACEFSLFAGSGGYSPVGAQGLLTAVASGSRVAGSVVVNTGSAAPSMWNLPEPGTEPVSSALAGGFLSLDHRGSPLDVISSQESLPDSPSGPGAWGRCVVRLQLSPLTK